jgi:hypothetical protein
MQQTIPPFVIFSPSTTPGLTVLVAMITTLYSSLIALEGSTHYLPITSESYPDMIICLACGGVTDLLLQRQPVCT